MQKKTYFFPALLLGALLLTAAGCNIPQMSGSPEDSEKESISEGEPLTQTSFKLDTIVTVSLYDSRDQELLSDCIGLCDQYEKIFSRTDEDSELYQLNHRLLPLKEGTTNTYQVSEPLAELLSLALSYSRDTDGAFDAAIAPLTSLWDFTSENPRVPAAADIQNAVEKCSCEGVSIDGRLITLSSPDTAFDLGAIAKGYIADQMKEYLLSHGVKSAVINLGGNILCIGEKAADTPFKIGIQKPFADRSETIAVMEIADKSVVSSGVYERYFEQDGKLYHHILDSKTGYPCDNGLISVTIISDRSVDGDALSTSCFALGLEKGREYLESLGSVQGVFITEDYEIHYTEGFHDVIRVSDEQDK